MKRLWITTTNRADYGIYTPLLHLLRETDEVKLALLVAGSHLSHQHGYTVSRIEKDGFRIAARVDTLNASSSAAGVAHCIGSTVSAFAQVFSMERPDLLVILGDRYEMYAAAVAALPFRIPLAHIHGGELTHGAIDDPLRHSMTIFSHLHYVATQEYARRVRQLGAEAERIHCCGALSLSHLANLSFMDLDSLETDLGIALRPAPLLVTFHPETTSPDAALDQVDALLKALESQQRPIIITGTNADTGGGIIRLRLEQWAADKAHVRLIESLGQLRYFSMMRIAAAMIGNSSSGIIEAASFSLPVVNIGSRQAGRVRARNVLDIKANQPAIESAMATACSDPFKASLAGLENPYFQADTAQQICSSLLHHLQAPESLLDQNFHDVAFA